MRPPLAGKGANFYDRKRSTAARRGARRRARTRGRRAWLSTWPHQVTEKGGKNAGRAPAYRADLLTGDPGPLPGQKGAWPYDDDAVPRMPGRRSGRV